MSNLFEDHIATFLALIAGTGLTTFDSQVADGAPAQYVVVYPTFETPDGTVAPDTISLTLASTALDIEAIVHSVGPTAQSARATAARSYEAVLDQVLAVPNRSSFPIRWREGQPVRRNEEVPGRPVFDQIDVYGWRSLPA